MAFKFFIILNFRMYHYLTGYCSAQDKTVDELWDGGNKKSSHEAAFETGALSLY